MQIQCLLLSGAFHLSFTEQFIDRLIYVLLKPEDRKHIADALDMDCLPSNVKIITLL